MPCQNLKSLVVKFENHYLLPVNEAVVANDNIAPIVWQEGRFQVDQTASKTLMSKVGEFDRIAVLEQHWAFIHPQIKRYSLCCPIFNDEFVSCDRSCSSRNV